MIRRDFTRLQGKSYEGPRLRNPFFSQSPGKRTLIALGALASIGCAAVVAVLLYAPFMHYREVVVSGATTLQGDDVRAASNEFLQRRVAFIVPGTHIIFGREQALIAYLTERYTLDSVRIERKGRVLTLTIKERISEVAWQSADTVYLLDLQGVVVRETSSEELAVIGARLAQSPELPVAPGMQPTMPILVDTSTSAVTIGSALLAPSLLQDLLVLDEMLRARALLPVGYRFASPTSTWFTVETMDGVALLFDLQHAPVMSAIGYLDVYLDEHPDARSTLEYIDLRFDNHIYTKPR